MSHNFSFKNISKVRFIEGNKLEEIYLCDNFFYTQSVALKVGLNHFNCIEAQNTQSTDDFNFASAV